MGQSHEKPKLSDKLLSGFMLKECVVNTVFMQSKPLIKMLFNILVVTFFITLSFHLSTKKT